MAEMLFEVGGQARDLFALVIRRDGDQDGFVKAAADQLDLSGADEGFEAAEILGAMLFDPSEQRTGIVDARMFFQEFDERQIGFFVGLFEHVAKITARLVGMNQKDEMKAFWHGTILLANIIPCSATFPIHEMTKMRKRANFNGMRGTLMPGASHGSA